MVDFQTVGVSVSISVSVLGGLIKLFVRSEARKELKDDLTRIHDRIDNVADDYVPCKYCNMQHQNLDNKLNSMDTKLDILINK